MGKVDEVSDEIEAAIVFNTEEAILKYFSFKHLPDRLRGMSAMFGQLAITIVEKAPRCAERTVALRKLLEGKDAAVRALL